MESSLGGRCVQVDGGEFAHVYCVELYRESNPSFSKRDLYEALKKRCPGAEPIDGTLDTGSLHFVHLDHRVQLKDGSLPAQTLIAESEKNVSLEALEPALQQSWGFPGVREAVARARSIVLVTDLMSSPLAPKTRIELFVRALAAVLEVTPCAALHWPLSGHLSDPAKFLQRAAESEAAALIAGPINVRLFNVSNAPGAMVMDTLGLTALGLPDLQCHFRDLHPNEVARFLYNTALYVLERGDVIEDGHTVQGITETERWPCRHERSLVEPTRFVVDISPGRRFGAGNRN